MKKVLGIVISQRKLGNSELLVKEIMSQIPEECVLELIRLTDLNLKPCQACYRCLQPGSACPLPDDFNFVLNKIQEADALIIGMPVYILGPHGYYKMLTDRFVGAENYAERTKGKPCVLVLPYGTDRWEGYSKAAALALPLFLKMKIADCWQVKATLPGEGVLAPAYREYARALGQSLFHDRIYDPGARACSCCGSDMVRLLPQGRVECGICGAQGVLTGDNLPDFTRTDYCRFREEEREEHFKVFLVEMKEKFLRERERIKEIQQPYKDLNWWVAPKE